MPLLQFSRARKGIEPFLFLILLISCKTPCPQWELATISATHPCSTFVRISRKCDTFQGLDAEILCHDGVATFFLNSRTGCFPDDGIDGTIKVAICVTETTKCFSAIRLEGGQRIQLCEDAKNLIVATLLNGGSVNISVGTLQVDLIPDNFDCAYSMIS